MAAGMASRYGSMKQIQGFGPGGETIMDYSIYDAIKAGFDKVVFIIRKDFAEQFKAIFEPKLAGKIETAYVYQDIEDFLGAHSLPADRKKPWGTSHAILCAKDDVTEPFAVINADDFYGSDGFVKAQQFLSTECSENVYALVGYELAKTLSTYGSVSRGVCEADANNNLITINERLKLYRENGKIIYEDPEGGKHEVPEDAKTSMNFWCFHPSIFAYLEEEFKTFLDENINDLKAEFLIPSTADKYIKSGRGVLKVLPTNAQWFGVTYKEDAPIVTKSIKDLVDSGVYAAQLW
jgi:UTP-glucose-1-phosphate uridylyltransferase